MSSAADHRCPFSLQHPAYSVGRDALHTRAVTDAAACLSFFLLSWYPCVCLLSGAAGCHCRFEIPRDLVCGGVPPIADESIQRVLTLPQDPCRVAVSVWSWTKMSSPSGPSPRYVAILSPSVGIIHNWCDGTYITRRLGAGGEACVLATRCFSTQKDSLCWLTNPIFQEAIAASASLADKTPSTTAAAGTSWLAVVSASSRSCFETDATGLAAALSVVQRGSCVCCRFASASRAWEWLDGGAPTSLLEVVGESHSESILARSTMTERSPVDVSVSGLPSTSSVAASARSPSAPPQSVALSGLTPRSSVSRTSVRGPPSCTTPRQLGKRRSPAAFVRGGADVSPVLGLPPVVARQQGALEAASDGEDVGLGSELVFRSLPKRRKGALCRETLRVPDSPTASWGGSSLQSSATELVDCGWSNDSSASTQDTASMEVRELLRSYNPVRTHTGRRVHAGAPGASATVARGTSRPAGVRDGGDGAETSASSPIGDLAAAGEWESVCEQLFGRIQSAFVSGGPGAGKSTLLRHLFGFLCKRYPGDGEVVVLAPTGTSAKTAGGMTYHSFFGFIRDYEPLGVDPRVEAARLLATGRFGPIKARLRQARAVLLDEVSLVAADKLGVMHELLIQARAESARPCLWFMFGDFLQVGPVKGAPMAFTAPCWDALFGGAFLHLPGTFRQRDAEFIRAVRDARVGECSPAVNQLVADCWVEGAQYDKIKTDVFHLMPRHKEVLAHNHACLHALTGGAQPQLFNAKDDVEVDPDRDVTGRLPKPGNVPELSRKAALSDCVAPPTVPHCLRARVMIVNNRMQPLGVCHGSIGYIVGYELDGTPVVRLDNHVLPPGVQRGSWGLRDAGDNWLEVLCPPVKFTARLLSFPGLLATRTQVPFVLGWATTIHMSQSLSISSAVLDLAHCFEAGMAQTAISRVPTKEGLFFKSFCASRLYANPLVLQKYGEWRRL